ncbi:MAG: NDP-sugar synthase [Deltaproteobacteria bacterium]|nr:NDP-sugar synthase [Deltaproteobacteria bacterium]
MLLAAGLGTRLRPLTDLRPKPIVPVANRPLAAFAMEHLARSGVHSVVANTHPQPEQVEAALKAACPAGLKLRFSREKTLLGTGGGLRKASLSFDDAQAPVVVMNGDTLFAPDLRHACAEHLARGAVATMILRRLPNPERFGAIGLDGDGWVRSLLGVPGDAPIRDSFMFTGVHILVDTGAPVLGIIDDSPWADLGTVPDYHRVNLELASGLFPWHGVESHDGCILPASVEPSANVRQSVVGANVSIGLGVTLDRCVVWPGTKVTSAATNAVLTPKHRIEVGRDS